MQRTLRYASAQFQPLPLAYKFQPRASREAQSDAATLIDKGIPARDATYDRRNLSVFPGRRGLRQ